MISTGFKCSSCKKKVDIEKDLTIFRFPKILVIHLKRFYHSAMRREKLNTTVNFPETLDMTSFAPHSGKSQIEQGHKNLEPLLERKTFIYPLVLSLFTN